MKTMLIIFMLMMTNIAGGTGQVYQTDSFTTKDGKSLKITFIGHGSLFVDFEGHTIYIDPVSEYADYSRFPKAEVILITHEHHDHLDPVAIGMIRTPDTKIIANASSQEKAGAGTVMKNGDQLDVTPWFRLEAIPAYNLTPGRDIYHPAGRDNGYVLTLGGTRVYIAGDTEDIPEMKKLRAIDIAFLPVNQPYTMTVDQAARAARMIRPGILYPYHYGSTDVSLLKEKLKDQPDTEVRIRQLQ